MSGPFFHRTSNDKPYGAIVNYTSELQRRQDLSNNEGGGAPADGSTSNVLTASGELDARRSQTELRFPGGQILRVPTAFLLKQSGRGRGESFVSEEDRAGGEPVVIPVIEEHLEVGKRTVVTGTVLLEKQTQEYQEALDVPLAVRTFDIERVVLNQPVDSPPMVRQEGETTIYPLLEEQLVLTTHLVLKEEVRVTRRDTERRDTRTVTLKRESLTVTRKPAPDGRRTENE